MKNSYENILKRRKNIENYLTKNSKATVIELSRVFNASEPTIRRDLTVMEEMGIIKRFHGGCLINSMEKKLENIPSELLTLQNKIARKAESYIKDGDTILVNTSSTAEEVISLIKDKRVIVITNNAHMVHLDLPSSIVLLLTGGEVRYPRETLTGDLAINTIQQLYVDVSIIGCSGYSVNKGTTTDNLLEAKINNLMVQNSRKTILVCDYRKIGYEASFISAKPQDIDILITDTFSTIKQIKEIEDLGVEVVTVD